MVNQNFINFLAEGQPEYTDGGVLAEFTWLIVVLPFLAAILITFFGKYLPLHGAELALGTVLFILLSAEFVALVLILVYIGAVIVLFLFGVMITRAPLGPNAELDNDQNKLLAAVISLSIFGIFTYILLQTFDATVDISEGTSTKLLGEILLSRFVFPFELVSFVLLGALIGGITLARKDNALMDEDQI